MFKNNSYTFNEHEKFDQKCNSSCWLIMSSSPFFQKSVIIQMSRLKMLLFIPSQKAGLDILDVIDYLKYTCGLAETDRFTVEMMKKTV